MNDRNKKSGVDGTPLSLTAGKWLLLYLLLPIVIPVITTVITNRYINPPPLLENISTNVIYNAGAIKDSSFVPFRFRLDVDTIPWIAFNINNDGNTFAEDFEIEFKPKIVNRIVQKIVKYNPTTLVNKREGLISSDSLFYEKLCILPAKSSIDYKFVMSSYIETKSDFSFSISTKRENLLPQVKLRINALISSFNTRAYALGKKPPKTDSSIIAKHVATDSGSGILIGGYDPLILTNGLLKIVQDKRVVTPLEAKEIIKITESYREGVLLGGINYLKFNELLLNLLIQKGIISSKEASSIVEKSKNAGGVLIGGFNVITLEVEILNILLQKGIISYSEGQNIIDAAQPKH